MSCNDSENKAKLILKNKLELTDIEIAEYQFKTNNISDREYCDIQYDYSQKLFKELQTEYDLKRSGKYADSLKFYNGNRKFKEVLFYRLKNSDTINKGYLYFNENGKNLCINNIK